MQFLINFYKVVLKAQMLDFGPCMCWSIYHFLGPRLLPFKYYGLLYDVFGIFLLVQASVPGPGVVGVYTLLKKKWMYDLQTSVVMMIMANKSYSH
jgi:hypothetical protein